MGSQRWIDGALITAAVASGPLLPHFYDWSGEDQSRSAPIVRWIGLAILIMAAVAIVWLLVMHMRSPAPPRNRLCWGQFGIRHLMIAMISVALIVSAERIMDMPLTNALLVAMVSFAVWRGYKQSEWRWPVAVLLACLWGPFLWVLTWSDRSSSMNEWLVLVPGIPALLPAAFTGWLFGLNLLENRYFPGLFTAVEFGLGLWTIRFGSRPATAYALVIVTLSLFGSFLLQALVRM